MRALTNVNCSISIEVGISPNRGTRLPGLRMDSLVTVAHPRRFPMNIKSTVL